jgi:hypothetical protein
MIGPMAQRAWFTTLGYNNTRSNAAPLNDQQQTIITDHQLLNGLTTE